jgi:hypothetical protein
MSTLPMIDSLADQLVLRRPPAHIKVLAQLSGLFFQGHFGKQRSGALYQAVIGRHGNIPFSYGDSIPVRRTDEADGRFTGGP